MNVLLLLDPSDFFLILVNDSIPFPVFVIFSLRGSRYCVEALTNCIRKFANFCILSLSVLVLLFGFCSLLQVVFSASKRDL